MTLIKSTHSNFSYEDLFICPIYLAKVPVSNLEVVHLLRSLQPILQEAVQQRRHQRLWEVTYPVLGPLTWRQFHRLAGRGNWSFEL